MNDGWTSVPLCAHGLYREGMSTIEPSGYTLDEQLCFALYTASRAMTGCYRPMLDRMSLTYPQYLVMLVLWERGEATVGGLGAALHLETGTLSPLLKRLEATGLIWRRRRRDDERSVLIGLTDAGRELHEPARALPGRIGAATGMTLAERFELRDMLHSLAEQLRCTQAESA
jgi:MarR family transcriptional regulator, organic hydroperoxide resistance regulator